jgi:PAS domain S-box-containing protein
MREREYFERTGVRSTVAVPLIQGDRLLGAAIFSTTRVEVIWQDSVVQRLRLFGEVFANALARKMMEEAGRDLLRFEQLVSDISARLAGASSNRVDEEIQHALQVIVAFFDADHCAIVEAISHTGEAYIRYQARRAGSTPLATDGDFATLDPWEYARVFIRGEVVILQRPEQFPTEGSSDGNTDAAIQLRSLLCIPIAVGSTIPYLFGLAFRGAERTWAGEYLSRLRLLGETLISALLRARAEEALRTNEERFRRVVEAALNGVMMIDMDGRIVIVNSQLESTFGYGREELLGKQVEMLLPPRYRDRHRAYRSQFMADPEVRPMGAGLELYGLRKDGTEVPIEIGLNPIRMSEELFVLATVVDISARKQAEQELRASAQRLAEAQRIARLGSWEWDIAADTTTGSEEARRILGGGPEEFNRFLDYVHPDDWLELKQAIEQLFRDREESFELEYRIIRPDGAERIIRDQGNIYYASDGKPLRALGTVQDVTDLRLAEQEARKLRTQLWHADRVVRTGALTASLAHELNQPLAAILSNAQAALRFLARDNADLAEVKDILRDIVRDDKRAAAVVSGLRAMVRRQQTERATIDMAVVVGEMLAFLHSELIAANIEVARDFQPGCRVLADRVQLQQVVLNLVMNAIEAMREPTVEERRLQLTVRRTASDTVRVAMRDSGPGIPQERLDSVFDAFCTTKAQGMGLGLAVCWSIVDAHGGRIWVENNDGDPGITFLFELPSFARGDVAHGASGPGTGDGETR